MFDFKHKNLQDIPEKRKAKHDGYEHIRRDFLHWDESEKLSAIVYEIPPKQSAYPYHFHHKNEELFYIISGTGVLKNPEGERQVKAGDLLFFPANEKGAHKLTNCSETENLVYLDVDIIHDLDVTIYPDSGKIGIWGKGINKIYKEDDDVDYYEGE